MAESLRDKSRINWANDSNSNENIQLGCLLRIADASEKMARRHTELISDREMYERWWKSEVVKRKFAERRAATLKTQITKLEKQLAAAKERT